MSPDELKVSTTLYTLYRLPAYDLAIRRYRKLEPALHEAVLEGIARDLEGGDLDEMPGTGGWIKGRVASPSRGIGKSGGFRVIYLFLRINERLYLQDVYDHRTKAGLSHAEKVFLKQAAQAVKRALT